MANIKEMIAAHLSQRQRQINKATERAEILAEDRLPCNIIRVGGNINVPSRPGFVWCQEYSPNDDTSPFHAFNSRVQAREGLPVWVGQGLDGRREILGWRSGVLVNTAGYKGQKYAPLHHTDHEWPDFKPGSDVVNVYPRSLAMLRTYPGESGSLTISVSPLRYVRLATLTIFPGKNNLDISASQPASGLARFVGIYLDYNDNTIKTVDGATTSDSPTVFPDSPTFPDEAVLSALVRLDGTQTSINEVDIVDARQIVDFSAPAASVLDSVKVSKVYESDGGAVALQADADGDIGIGTSGPQRRLEVEDSATAQLRLTHTALTKFTDFTVNTNHRLRITPSSNGQVQLLPTADSTNFFEVVDSLSQTTLAVDTTNRRLGVNTSSPDASLEIIATTTQMRLTHTDASKFTNFTVDTNHDLTITPSSTGQVILQPTTDSVDFFQVLDADGGAAVFNVDATNERVSIGMAAPQKLLHIGPGTDTPTVSADGAYVAINGNAAIIARDNTNDVELFGLAFTSSGIIGTATNHNLKIRTNNTDQVEIDTSGRVGIGVTAPQGRLHTYGAVAGWMRWEYDGLDDTVRTIIPDGTGDVLYVCRFTHVMRDNLNNRVGASNNVNNGASVNVTVGSNTVRLRVNANGSADIARTAGTGTIKVGLMLQWL